MRKGYEKRVANLVLLVGLCTTGLDGLAKIDWPALIGEERRDPP